jgi:hypothetical protein
MRMVRGGVERDVRAPQDSGKARARPVPQVMRGVGRRFGRL